MKRIIRLTEQDIARIVKRVIMENPINVNKTVGLAGVKGDSVKDVVTSLQRGKYVDPSIPQKCSDLEGRVSDEWAFDVRKYESSSKKQKGDSQDPYEYVELVNGTYCVTDSSKYDTFGTEKWTTVTDPKMKDIVKDVLKNVESDYIP